MTGEPIDQTACEQAEAERRSAESHHALRTLANDALGRVQAEQKDPVLYDILHALCQAIDGDDSAALAYIYMGRNEAREQLAQDTAEYIATVLMPKTAETHASAYATVHYADGKRPPTDIAGIKAHLLSGGCWISWMDDRVCAAMRALHGAPTGDAEWLASIAVPLDASGDTAWERAAKADGF